MEFNLSRLDKLAMAVSPKWGTGRVHNKMKAEAMIKARDINSKPRRRRYDGAAKGTTMQGWEGANGGGPNADIEMDFRTLVARSEDLLRNNGKATNAQRIWTEGLIGDGMVGEIKGISGGQRERLIKNRTELWEAWTSNASEIDHAGVEDFNGIQAIICDGWFSGGNILVVRRRTSDNSTVPMRLQVIEGAQLDTFKTQTNDDGSTIVQGVQFSKSGRIQGIWVLNQHPGNSRINIFSSVKQSSYFDWSEIIHVFSSRRAGQVIGVPRLSNTILTAKDADDWEYAKLKQQMVASCFGALISGEDEQGVDDGNGQIASDDLIDRISPGMIEYIGLDRDVKTLTPPNADTGTDFLKSLDHKMAASIGVTYEDLTTDLAQTTFISGRLGRIRQNKMLKRERKTVFIPKCLNRIYRWFEEAAIISGSPIGLTKMEWTIPVPDLTDPKAEGDAINDSVRRGFISDQDAIRKYGSNPDEIIKDKTAWNSQLDENEIILDSDPRNISGAGQLQSVNDAVSKETNQQEARKALESGKPLLFKATNEDGSVEIWRMQEGKKPEKVSTFENK